MSDQTATNIPTSTDTGKICPPTTRIAIPTTNPKKAELSPEVCILYTSLKAPSLSAL